MKNSSAKITNNALIVKINPTKKATFHEYHALYISLGIYTALGTLLNFLRHTTNNALIVKNNSTKKLFSTNAMPCTSLLSRRLNWGTVTLFPSNPNVSRDEVEGNIEILGKQNSLLYSWHFSLYSTPIHWLVHGHMTSNNETVSRQMP